MYRACIDFLSEITNHAATIWFYDRDKSSVMKLDKFPNTQKFLGGARIIKRRDILAKRISRPGVLHVGM